MTQHNPAHSPRLTLLSYVAWKRALRCDEFESVRLRVRRAPDWTQHAAKIGPAVGVKTPTPGPQSPATDAWRPPEQWAWWEKIPARTAVVVAYIVTAAVAVGSALFARGDLR